MGKNMTYVYFASVVMDGSNQTILSAPVMASRKQDEKHRYRFEFQVQTLGYAIE